MKYKSKNIIKWIVGIPMIVSMILTLLISFFFPVIIAIYTLDWWYLMLFMVSWIPTIAELFAFSLILDAFKKI